MWLFCVYMNICYMKKAVLDFHIYCVYLGNLKERLPQYTVLMLNYLVYFFISLCRVFTMHCLSYKTLLSRLYCSFNKSWLLISLLKAIQSAFACMWICSQHISIFWGCLYFHVFSMCFMLCSFMKFLIFHHI